MLSNAMSKRFVNTFGQRVKEQRLARKMSQEELADAAKLHRTHISLIERGKRQVRLDTVEQLAMALAVQPAQLMPEVRIRLLRRR